MSRLTKPGYKFNLLNVMQGLNTHAEADEVLNRLAAYEDAEEQGLLVRLPCKIGDTVWAIRSYRGILRPQQGVVSEMYFRLDMTLQIVVKHVARGELGRTIFLTREEAEAALERSRA